MNGVGSGDAGTEIDILLGSSRLEVTHDGAPARLDPLLPADVFVRGGLIIDSHRDPTASRGRSEAAAGRRSGTPRRRRGDRGRDEQLLPRGAIVDKYRIDGLLGKGGFAAVYRATHLLLGTQVAIKLLRPKVLERQPALTSLLCEEARFAARINHANVVRIFDVTSGAALTYIVMEYIEGLSLSQRIERQGPLAPAALLQVGLQVAAGLHAGLEQGLIHRDVKPANILLTNAGDAKLVDFGLAYQSAAVRDGRRARSGSVIGTSGYMSPEQADDPETVDFRGDIYSLGVTLYEAATGAPPFAIGDAQACILAHKTQPVPPPASRVPGFPPAASSLLLWMLAKAPSERPQSYGGLAQQMRRVLASLASLE